MKNRLHFLLIALFSPSLFANSVSESQSKWYNKYKKQANVPKIEDMLINTESEPDLKTGFVDLYNKKDLNGWTPLGGYCKFEANGDLITGTCVPKSPSTYLSTKKTDYKNFVFTCEIKWEVDGNTGVMFRARVKEGKDKKGNLKTTVFGPQIEMEGLEQGRGWSGGVYGQSCGGYWYPLWLDSHKDIRAALHKGWNRVTIKADGNNVKTWVNGIPAANWNTEEYMEGYFGLQVHSGKKGKVHFKNIRVKEL